MVVVFTTTCAISAYHTKVVRQPWKPRAYTVPSLIVLFFFNNILGFLAYYFSGKNE
jgi:hypothetical protein